MSLSRTALRLAVVEALSPFAQHANVNPIWPTFAGRQVFDSKISAVALTSLDPLVPSIVVTTDQAKTAARGSAQDVTVAGDGKETCTLGFEIMVPVKIEGDQGETVAMVGPTDAMAKALIEMIEDQIHQRLVEARMTGPLRHILLSVEEIESFPYNDPDTDVPLSALRLELTCHIRQRERWTPPPPEWTLRHLPEPLRSVALALPAGSYGHQLCIAIDAMIGNPAAFGPLNEIRLAGNLAREPGDAPPPDADPGPTPPIGDAAARIIL